MSIHIYFENIDPVKIKINQVKSGIKSLIITELNKVGVISIILCSDNYLLDINKKFLNHDYFTDIVTFNYCEGNIISGDLFISIDRIKENANLFNTSFNKELYRVIYHGVLHLIGYNDKTDDEKVIMRQKEDFYLNELEF